MKFETNIDDFHTEREALKRIETRNRAIALLKVLTQMRRDAPELFSAVKDYVQSTKQSEATK